MRKSSRPSRWSPQAAFTLIELLVTIGIIAILASVLLSVLSSAKEGSRSTQCISNMRQIGLSMALYANDNNGRYPALKTNNVDWDSDAILPYIPERYDKRQNVIFICPSAVYKGFANKDLSRAYSSTECMIGPGGSYSIGNNRNNFVGMAGTLVLFDAMAATGFRYANEVVTWGQVSGATDIKANSKTSTYIDYRHRDAFHGLFADGHVDTITRTAAPTLITKVKWTGSDR